MSHLRHVSTATDRASLLFVGHVADGIVARRCHQEPRAGGSLDILCDRLCIAVYSLSYGQLHHALLVPIALFLFESMVLDAACHWPSSMGHWVR